MSADLLAELDSFYSGSSSSQQGQPSQPSQRPAQQQPAHPANDPFGFLGPSFSTTAPSQPSSQPPPLAWPVFQAQRELSTNNWGGLTGLGALQNTAKDNNADDDDGWGDFEVASPVAEPVPPVASPNIPSPPRQAQPPAPDPDGPPRTRVVRASTMDLLTNNLVDIAAPAAYATLETWQERPSWEERQPTPPKPKKKNSDPDVLFDADDFDGEAPVESGEEDEFGDFETVVAAAAEPSADLMSADLLSTDPAPAAAPARLQPPSQLLSGLSISTSPTSPYPHAPKSPSFRERNPFPGLGLKTPTTEEFPKQTKRGKSPSPVTAWPSFDAKPGSAPEKEDSFGDGWTVFEDLPAEAPKPAPRALQTKQAAKPASKPRPSSPPSSWDWDAVDTAPPAGQVPKPAQLSAVATSVASSVPDSMPPPTNIPPPSILLSIFPQLFEQANTALLKPAASQPAAVKSRVLSDPATAAFLRGHLLLATVAARILAGRKQRWHRDKFLMQGMSISAAGGKGGMKLAGVDKAQAAREDREAADVAAAWKSHVGRLRSAVAAASSAGQGPLRVPEISERMAVQTAKMVPTAPKACVVCGLKRDERVAGVDLDVEDSLGEWWVEHWGHRACRNFWLEHEGTLRSR